MATKPSSVFLIASLGLLGGLGLAACSDYFAYQNRLDHCWWAAGDATCKSLYPGELEYCSRDGDPCNVTQEHGCVAARPALEVCHSPCGYGQTALECPGDTAAEDDSGETSVGGESGETTAASESDDDGETAGGDECLDCAPSNCIMDSCVVVESCFELVNITDVSDVYELTPADGSPPYFAYCDMETLGGGWTLVLKVNAYSNAFTYDSSRWTQKAPYQAENYQFDHTEAKLPSWSKVPFHEVMIGMEAPPSDRDPPRFKYVVANVEHQISLFDLIADDKYTPTNIARSGWMSLIDDSTLQPNCNKQGFNVNREGGEETHHSVRIGIIANNEDNCDTPNSRIGIGGEGGVVGTCTAIETGPNGNFTTCNDNGGNVSIPAFGAVFVR